jgi:hypothetical protein
MKTVVGIKLLKGMNPEKNTEHSNSFYLTRGVRELWITDFNKVFL